MQRSVSTFKSWTMMSSTSSFVMFLIRTTRSSSRLLFSSLSFVILAFKTLFMSSVPFSLWLPLCYLYIVSCIFVLTIDEVSSTCRKNKSDHDRYHYSGKDIEATGLLSKNVNNNINQQSTFPLPFSWCSSQCHLLHSLESYRRHDLPCLLQRRGPVWGTSKTVSSSSQQRSDWMWSLYALSPLDKQIGGCINDKNAYICTECNNVMNVVREPKKKTHVCPVLFSPYE